MHEDLVLDGKADKTIEAYLGSVRQLAYHFGQSPDKLSESQVRDFLLYLVETRGLKPNSMRPVLAGLKFFYGTTVPRDWATLRAMRIPKTRTLPAVLTAEDAWRVIDATRVFYFQTFFRTAFTCGLRPGDTRHLKTTDIDGERMVLHVRATKGGNERCIPLPQATLSALRTHWASHRNPTWIFPARKKLSQMAVATRPISQRAIQRAFEKVVRSLRLKQVGLRPHTLRHSYATCLLEEGVNLRVLQSYLGHKNLQATEVYLHLTRHSDAKAREIIDRMMNGPVDRDDVDPESRS